MQVSAKQNLLKTNALVQPTPAQAARFLLQAGFSARLEEINEVIKLGYEPWLDAKMQEHKDQRAITWLYAQKLNTKPRKIAKKAFTHLIWQQFFASHNQLRKRMALALSEILVVSALGVGVRHRSFAMGYYWDLLNQHAFGSYRTLLEDISLCPAMGQYLSTHKNRHGILAATRNPDENYAREILQLFSIGLEELNIDGSVKTNAQGKPIETYNIQDIAQLAHVFTGWEFKWKKHTSKAQKETIATPLHMPMQLLDKYHSNAEVTLFKQKIPAHTKGDKALSTALDLIFAHPNVAPFIAKQLIQRLVTSNPSNDYIQRVAQVFNDNGKGQKGDLGATLKAILLDKQARQDNSLQDPYFGKVREPIVRVLQWGKTFKAHSVSGTWKAASLASHTKGVSQMPMHAPSVFNFFRPNFVPANAAFTAHKLHAPELQIINETTAVSYYNSLRNLIMQGIKEDGNYKQVEIAADYRPLLPLANQPDALLARLNLTLTANQLSTNSLQIMQKALQDIRLQTKNGALNRVKTAIFLIMSSYDYLLQK